MVWAREGAPVTLCTSIPPTRSWRRSSAPSRRPVRSARWAAGGGGSGWHQGMDGRTGRRFIWHMFHARPGGGASSGGDGWPTAGEWHSVGGIKFGSVEMARRASPAFRAPRISVGSGGAGRHRGGLGGKNSPSASGPSAPLSANTCRRRRAARRRPGCRAARMAGRTTTGCAMADGTGSGGIRRPRRSASPSGPATGRSSSAGGGVGPGDPAKRYAVGAGARRGRRGTCLMAGLTIGIDVGGTFTDIVVLAADGGAIIAKAATTRRTSRTACSTASPWPRNAWDRPLPLLRATSASSTAPPSPPSAAGGKAARLGMLTTEGHRDVIEMREG